jgi:hypothetical protein
MVATPRIYQSDDTIAASAHTFADAFVRLYATYRKPRTAATVDILTGSALTDAES